MDKKEFLKQLENSLSFNLPTDEVAKQINYYDDYISNEVKNGRKEKDVLDEIGDPILIAKTIKQITVNADNTNNENNYNNDYNNGNNNDYNSDYDNEKNVNNTNNKNYGRVYSTGGLGCALSGLLMLILFFFGMRILGVVVSSVFYIFGPFSIFLIVVLWFMFFGRR